MSVAGRFDLAINRAVECGFNCLQIFTHSPRVWDDSHVSAEDITAFRQGRMRHKLSPVVVHAPYLPNLASPDSSLWRLSREVIARDLLTADAVRADYYVVHPGSSKGRGAAYGVKRVGDALCRLFAERMPKLTFLLENTSGAGSTVGGTFEELAEIIARVKAEMPDARLGICLDTAHVLVSGHDFRTLEGVAELRSTLRRTIGLRALKVIHCNDSVGSVGSRRDHHAHIGEGHVGLEGFRNLLRWPTFRRVPWILETPKEPDGSDQRNRVAIQRLFREAMAL
jgi:deoxyribonuclease-4